MCSQVSVPVPEQCRVNAMKRSGVFSELNGAVCGQYQTGGFLSAAGGLVCPGPFSGGSVRHSLDDVQNERGAVVKVRLHGRTEASALQSNYIKQSLLAGC